MMEDVFASAKQQSDGERFVQKSEKKSLGLGLICDLTGSNDITMSLCFTLGIVIISK